MAKVRVVTLKTAEPVGVPHGSRGDVECRAYLAGAGDPLHLVHSRMGPDASLLIGGEPNDRAVYVWKGAVRSGDLILREGSSMVVEYGAEAEIVTDDVEADVLVFHEPVRGAARKQGGHVHAMPAERVPRTDDLGTFNEMGGGIHADADCPHCSVWLHSNDFHSKDGTVTPLHSHSEDEIIFVTAGGVILGKRHYGPGTALAVAADTVYGFDSAPGGLSFINFRTASPTATSQNGTMLIDEAQFWISRLGKPQPVPVAGTPARHTGLTS